MAGQTVSPVPRGAVVDKNGVPTQAFSGFLQDVRRALGLWHPIPSYTVATVPDASAHAWKLIGVTDESGGAVVAFSDGTNWRRLTDRAVIS